MIITVNGKHIEVNAESTLADYLQKKNISEGKGIAIAVDNEVIPKNRWDEVKFRDGMTVEIVRAVQGG